MGCKFRVLGLGTLKASRDSEAENRASGSGQTVLSGGLHVAVPSRGPLYSNPNKKTTLEVVS